MQSAILDPHKNTLIVLEHASALNQPRTKDLRVTTGGIRHGALVIDLSWVVSRKYAERDGGVPPLSRRGGQEMLPARARRLPLSSAQKKLSMVSVSEAIQHQDLGIFHKIQVSTACCQPSTRAGAQGLSTGDRKVEQQTARSNTVQHGSRYPLTACAFLKWWISDERPLARRPLACSVCVTVFLYTFWELPQSLTSMYTDWKETETHCFGQKLSSKGTELFQQKRKENEPTSFEYSVTRERNAARGSTARTGYASPCVESLEPLSSTWNEGVSSSPATGSYWKIITNLPAQTPARDETAGFDGAAL
ncbi:hypothetical protein DER46DRAFT_581451 [Fusarium sp. MPI-SDFR-AT-0072]|nr:hypothetical protein DER46DRAFT_581451 [Fusarium sp. MPI-SDFR-AT-0072]